MARSILALFLAMSTAASACTTFALPQSSEKIVGKSYDWFQHTGIALVNPRNLEKSALLLNNDKPAQWTSKYGSLTFNQHGREMPLGGTNEKGLTVEIMWLDSAQYPGSNPTPAINELQWIQYQLDNAATVDEVVALAGQLRVSPVVAKVHYLICDTTGACATFEYLAKTLYIHEGAAASVTALTNDTYASSLRFLSGLLGFGGTKAIPTDKASLSRFARAANRVKAFDPAQVSDPVDYAFQTLASVEQPNYTTWNIVYETVSRRIHFRSTGLPRIKHIDASRFDYSCKAKPRFVDIKAATDGDVTPDFKDFEPQNNVALVNVGMAPFANQVPAGTLARVAKYPATLRCQE
jgi:penicillin V acylase-like amidase (Ntn superfamily)